MRESAASEAEDCFGLLGVAETLKGVAVCGLERLSMAALDGVQTGNKSKIPSTWPSFCGVGPRALRMNAGVGSSSLTGESCGACCNAVLEIVLRGVDTTAFGGRSLRTSRASSG